MNLGIDVEVEVALFVHADLNGSRPGRLFRNRLPVQDLDRIVPLNINELRLLQMVDMGDKGHGMLCTYVMLYMYIPLRNVLPLGKLIHVFVVVFISGVYDKVNLRMETCC